jgi:hypothetical protein
MSFVIEPKLLFNVVFWKRTHRYGMFMNLNIDASPVLVLFSYKLFNEMMPGSVNKISSLDFYIFCRKTDS